jgi:hypothetical protein
VVASTPDAVKVRVASAIQITPRVSAAAADGGSDGGCDNNEDPLAMCKKKKNKQVPINKII